MGGKNVKTKLTAEVIFRLRLISSLSGCQCVDLKSLTIGRWKCTCHMINLLLLLLFLYIYLYRLQLFFHWNKLSFCFTDMENKIIKCIYFCPVCWLRVNVKTLSYYRKNISWFFSLQSVHKSKYNYSYKILLWWKDSALALHIHFPAPSEACL